MREFNLFDSIVRPGECLQRLKWGGVSLWRDKTKNPPIPLSGRLMPYRYLLEIPESGMSKYREVFKLLILRRGGDFQHISATESRLAHVLAEWGAYSELLWIRYFSLSTCEARKPLKWTGERQLLQECWDKKYDYECTSAHSDYKTIIR
jgi:hypothetical protein